MNISPLFQAILLVLLSGFVLSGMDSLGKVLMNSFPTHQVTWARFFFHAIFVSLLFSVQGKRGFVVTRAPMLQLLRGFCMVGVTTALYFAIKATTLAEATAIIYLSPVLVTLFAGVLLGEDIRSSHLLAVLLGFIGVIVITQPGFKQFEPAMLFAFLSAMLLALYFLLTSKVKHIDTPSTSLFYASIVGAVILSLLLPLWWVTPTASQWFLLILMGLLGATGHFLLIRAYTLVDASTLSPYLNIQVLAATCYSVFLFGDKLQWNFYLGSGLIVLSGVYLWHIEKR